MAYPLQKVEEFAHKKWFPHPFSTVPEMRSSLWLARIFFLGQ